MGTFNAVDDANPLEPSGYLLEQLKSPESWPYAARQQADWPAVPMKV